MNERITVALLAGGRSGEREVSLSGAAGVEKALDPEKYLIRRYDPVVDLARIAAEAAEIDVAFILLHGRFGEDGTVQGFLDLLDIPYQGSGVLGSALAMDKNLAKILYRQAGLPVAEWMMACPADRSGGERLLKWLCLPLVIKPLHQGSSLGMSIVRHTSELGPAIVLASQHDTEVMVEEYIAGREITVGVIGNDNPRPLPLVEIIPSEQYAFFNYEAKYPPGASREVCPAAVPPEIAALAGRHAVAAHQALHLRGYSRTDMILRNGELFLLETNTIPGMTPTSLFPQAAAAAGLDFRALLDHLLGLALEGRG